MKTTLLIGKLIVFMEHIENIVLKEHDSIQPEYLDRLQSIRFIGETDYMKIPEYLGICYFKGNLSASYFIGTCWLTTNLSVAVLPKIQNIDFIKMFLTALETDSEADYFAKCYNIDFDQPAIQTPKNLNILSPLLVLHFLTLLEKLVNRGLKRGYIIKEENLKSKIKGRIIWGNHLQKNVFPKREDRIFCRYQEYTIDIPENRLLKKALLFCEKVLEQYESIKKQDNYTEIKKRFSKLKQHLVNISDDIDVSQIQKIKANKLFVNYKSAIKVAKMILRRFDYSLQNASKTEESAPPFCIDMARLYEMWVFSKLVKAYPNQIDFQVKGHCKTAVDFIKKDEHLIMDAKYKTHYAFSNRNIIDDIREISGYARDTQILKELNIEKDNNEEVKCLIIYPEPISFPIDSDNTYTKDDTFYEPLLGDELLSQSTEIKEFRNFYKISIKLPMLQSN